MVYEASQGLMEKLAVEAYQVAMVSGFSFIFLMLKNVNLKGEIFEFECNFFKNFPYQNLSDVLLYLSV